jgi:hypothetical protein
MPELTRDEAASGLVGLTVVRARRKETTPATLKTTPTRANAAQAARRTAAGMYSGGVTNEIPHIASATTAATAGGGTINSSDLMRAPRET